METTNVEVGRVKSDNIQFKLSGKYKCTRSKRLFESTVVASIDEGSIVLKQNGVVFYLANDIIIETENFKENTCEVKDVIISIDFHWEQKEVQSFQGSIKLKLVDDKIQLINILPIENYLYSVISSEMRGDSSLELLKSHAIISRSWLLAQIEQQKELDNSDTEYSLINETEEQYIRWYDRADHSDFHVCADDHCKRYQGTTRAYNPNVIKAIKATEGEVLMNGEKIADASFSKSCGGVTERFENWWEPVEHQY